VADHQPHTADDAADDPVDEPVDEPADEARGGSVAVDLHLFLEGGIGREMVEGEAAVRAVV